MSNNRRYQGKGQFWIIGMIKNYFKKLKVNWINLRLLLRWLKLILKFGENNKIL